MAMENFGYIFAPGEKSEFGPQRLKKGDKCPETGEESSRAWKETGGWPAPTCSLGALKCRVPLRWRENPQGIKLCVYYGAMTCNTWKER